MRGLQGRRLQPVHRHVVLLPEGRSPGKEVKMRKPRPDPVMVHLEAYAYKRGDDTVNQPLFEHLKEEHPEAWARYSLGATIGDPEDQHYIEHGELTPEPEMIREIEADNRA